MHTSFKVTHFDCLFNGNIALKSGTILNRATHISFLMSNRFLDLYLTVFIAENPAIQIPEICIVANRIKNVIVLDIARPEVFVDEQ